MRPLQLIGLLLWRGGLLLAAVVSAVETMRLVARFVSVPAELEVGVALALGGAALILVSLILERVHDRRTEGNLLE